jgi:hypothetical protein
MGEVPALTREIWPKIGAYVRMRNRGVAFLQRYDTPAASRQPILPPDYLARVLGRSIRPAEVEHRSIELGSLRLTA